MYVGGEGFPEMKLDVQLNRELVRILKSIRQAVGSQRPPRKAVTVSVPNWELVSLKAEYERQHTMLRMVQKRESVKFNRSRTFSWNLKTMSHFRDLHGRL